MLQDVMRMKERGDVDGLIEALRYEGDLAVRAEAALSLGQLGDRRAVEPLISTLQTDSDPYVRSLAAEALGALGDPRARDALMNCLQADTMEAGLKAAEALGRLDTEPSSPAHQAPAIDEFDALVVDLGGGDHREATAAARKLGDSGEGRAVGPLLGALAGTDLDIRRAAAEALGKIGSPEAVPALSAALTDSTVHPERHVPLQISASNADARIEAARALGEIGDPAASDALRSVKHLQLHGLYRGCTLGEAAVEALGKLGATAPATVEIPSDDRLVLGLLSPDPGERDRAISSVEDSGEERSERLERAYRASCLMRDAVSSRAAEQRRLLGEAVDLEPEFSAPCAFLSNTYQYEEGSISEALDWATRAVAANTGDWLAWIQLGRVQVALGDAVEASRAFAESVRLDPEVRGGLLSEPYSYLLPVYERLGMTAEALDAASRIRDGGTGLDPRYDAEWRALVEASPTADLREALTGR